MSGDSNLLCQDMSGDSNLLCHGMSGDSNLLCHDMSGDSNLLCHNMFCSVDRIAFVVVLCTLFDPLNAQLNPICHLLALLGAHLILHVSGVRVNCASYVFLLLYFMYSYCYVCCVLYILFSSCQLAFFGCRQCGVSVLFPQL